MRFLSRWRKAALAALVVLVGGAGVYQYGPSLQLLPPTNVTVNAPAAGGYTDAEGALWVVASGGATSGTCPVGTPCTMTYALSTVADNGTIILNSGTYAGSITLQGSNHDGVTITATAAVKNALVWTCGSTLITDGAGNTVTDCGIVSGTDNRPLFSDTSVTVGTASAGSSGPNGVTLSFLRLDGGDPTNGWSTWLVGVEAGATDLTIDHSELFDSGGGIAFLGGLRHVFTNNYIHNHGAAGWPTCTDNDAHGIATYHFPAATRQPGWTNPTAGNGVLIKHNTLTDNQGDGFQDVGDQSLSLRLEYAILEGNNVYQNCEQGIDHKGARNHTIRYNDVHQNGTGGIGTNDSDGGVDYQHLDWWIYGNTIRDHDGYGLFSQQSDDGRWMVWNNVFYGNCQNYAYNCLAVMNVPPDTRFEHNLVWNNNRVSGANSVGGLNAETGSSVIIRNNIFYNNGNSPSLYGNIYSGSTATISNNRCYPTSPGTCGSGAETNAASDFTSLSVPYDFHLATGAQSIDAGTTLTANDANHTILIDLDGNTRPVDSVFDHGPYEYLGAPPVAWRLRPGDLVAALWLRRR